MAQYRRITRHTIAGA